MTSAFTARIEEAFADEPLATREELFGGHILASAEQTRPDLWPADWRRLDCTALSTSDWNTLSGLGLRQYLPALLTAAETGRIGCRITADYLLTDGLLDFHGRLPLRWQGVSGSWRDLRARHLSVLTAAQAGVVVEFLDARRNDPLTMDEARRRIEEALANFWLGHAGLDAAAFWNTHGRLPVAEPFDPATLERVPPLPDAAALKAQIAAVFVAPYPGDDNIRGSDLGCEPEEVAALYRGRTDWKTLEPAFLDGAGLGFLSPQAFRFYLPAFLLADLDGLLLTETPSFRLSHGLDNVGKVNRVNPLHYGELTWFESASERFSAFTRGEARAVVDYLRRCAAQDGSDSALGEAVMNFWWPRATAD